MASSTTSQDLFNKIRSKFSNLTIGNAEGESTADPKEAVFFDFEFSEDADTFGRISVSLADGESVKVFYNQGLVEKIDEEDKADWFAFLKELKDFAVTHQLGFDVRDITKSNLTKQDYQNLADANKTVNTDAMSEELSRITKLAGVSEGLTGTAKRSYEDLDKTRLIIRHSGKVDEEVPGARSRQIQSLYIENEDGERFKYPITHLAGARAMTRHVANGGRPHDEFGEHIIQTSEDIAKLNSFTRYVSNKDQLNDSAGDIIEQTKLKLENLRSYVKNLSKQSHYETASKDFKTADDLVLDDETANSYKDKFTLKNLDSKVEEALPLIHKIMSEIQATEEQPVAELDKDDKPLSDKDAKIPPPVDAGPIVQRYLTDPENKLVLRKDNTADQMLQRTNFTNKNTMLSSILGDIAARMLTKTPDEDRVANFASNVADEISQEGEPFFKPDSNYIRNKKIAFQLAKRYVDDYKKMKKDPDYVSQVRMDPNEYEPKKDRTGKAKEEIAFEGWAENVSEQKPYVSMYRGEDGKMVYDVLDKDGESAYKSNDYNTATKYMNTNFDTLAGRKPKMDSEQPTEEGMGDKIADMAQSMSKDEFMSKADELGLTPEEAAEHYEKMQGGAHAGKFEGNQFAQAVQKAKAAGMKAGDKFKVGDQEYTLKDAIELAGLQLDEFFSEEETAQTEQPETNAELERIKSLSNYQ